MDDSYAFEMASTCEGLKRQFGSDAGVGAFALRMGCTRILLWKKDVGTFVTRIGQNVLEEALPEVVNLIQLKKKLKRRKKESVGEEVLRHATKKKAQQ